MTVADRSLATVAWLTAATIGFLLVVISWRYFTLLSQVEQACRLAEPDIVIWHRVCARYR